MEFKTKRKTAVAFVLSMLILMLSVVYCMPKIADAADANGIDYLRHDYSGLTPDEVYNLKLDMNNNTSNAYSTSNQSDYILESDTAVVRIVYIDNYGEEIPCSGFIIDDNTIATAAHCVYDFSKKKFWDFTIYITDSVGRILQSMKPKYVHVPLKYAKIDYQNAPGYIYDYAMIVVDADLSGYEKFNLGIATNNFASSDTTISVSGYPNLDGQNEHCQKRYTATGKISDITGLRIIYDNITTWGGLSGGPVYVERELFGQKYKTAIGIHVRGGGYGTRITSDLLKFYYNNEEIVPRS
ncbi:MAG: trypsin-like serine protease [Oscillospiraceae bacterium]|nr:trypsin-like serine protease [Oscillospiraceae bacterium]